MKISFLDAAQSELNDAIDYYDDAQDWDSNLRKKLSKRWNGPITILKPGRRCRCGYAVALSIDFPTASYTKVEAR